MDIQLLPKVKDLLELFSEIEFYDSVGTPLLSTSPHLVIGSWTDALVWLNSMEWREYLLDGANAITENLADLARDDYDQLFPELVDFIDKVASDKILPRIAQPLPLCDTLKHVLANRIFETVRFACIELQFELVLRQADLGRLRPGVFAELSDWLIKGRLPCSALKTYPCDVFRIF